MLNQIRVNRKAALKLTVSGDLDAVKVPPMMVLILVENIFKYGVFDDSDYPANLELLWKTVTFPFIPKIK